ncbi:MAG: TraR/DksA family transcriptional regulator [Pseudomonadota bacterium]
MTELNVSQLATLRRQVAQDLAALEGDYARGRSAEAVVTLDQQSVGRLSRMDALQNQAMAKAHTARRIAQTVRLKAALLRMDRGDYGFCDDCGEPIAYGRLKLDPTVQRCVSCASG